MIEILLGIIVLGLLVGYKKEIALFSTYHISVISVDSHCSLR